METLLFLIVALFVTIFIAFLFIALVLFREFGKQRRALEIVSEWLGSKDIRRGKTYDAAHNTIDYQYRCGGRGGSSQTYPIYLHVMVPCPAQGELKVVRKGRAGRFLRSLGMGSKIQTGDPSFDRDVRIVSDTENFTAYCFQSSDKRKRIQEIFKKGFEEIRLDGEELGAICLPTDLKGTPGQSLIREVVECLDEMRNSISGRRNSSPGVKNLTG